MTPDEEKEANLFARCLLMPEDMLRRRAKEMAAGRRIDLLDDTDTFVKDLAKEFGVPVAAMILRLNEIGMVEL